MAVDEEQARRLSEYIERHVESRLRDLLPQYGEARASTEPEQRHVAVSAFQPSRPLMDTKLGKPAEFSGKGWEDFAFKFESYLTMLDPGMTAWLRQVKADTATTYPLSNMSDTEKQRAARAYFALVMLCKDAPLGVVRLAEHANGVEAYRLLTRRYDPRGKSRGLARLAKLISPSFPSEPAKFLHALAQWERDIQEYEVAAHNVLPEEIKCAVIVDKSPEEVRTYLLIHCGEGTSYGVLRLKLEEYVQAVQVTQNTTTPMDVDYVGKGHKQWKGKTGKGKDGGKGKGKTNKGETSKGDTRQKKGQEKGSVPNGKAKFAGICYVCGKQGHRASECRKRAQVNEVSDAAQGASQASSSTSPSPAIVATLMQDRAWICEVAVDHACTNLFLGAVEKDVVHDTKQHKILIDSGAVVSVCGVDDFPSYKLRPSTFKHRLVSAQGLHLKTYGEKHVHLTSGGVLFEVRFVVCEARRPIISGNT
eukprot:2669718-Amphidinium_carterae.1